MGFAVNDQVTAQYEGEDVTAVITHVRDVDDAPNKYRLLRVEDDWYLGWYPADQLSPVDAAPVDDAPVDEDDEVV